MRESPPVLPLNSRSAAKSFLRTAKNILRNVKACNDCAAKDGDSMTTDEAKQILAAKGFVPVDATLQIGDSIKEPLIAVKVSNEHQCFDDWCQYGVHPLATATSIKGMEVAAFEALIFEELEGNR